MNVDCLTIKDIPEKKISLMFRKKNIVFAVSFPFKNQNTTDIFFEYIRESDIYYYYYYYYSNFYCRVYLKQSQFFSCLFTTIY